MRSLKKPLLFVDGFFLFHSFPRYISCFCFFDYCCVFVVFGFFFLYSFFILYLFLFSWLFASILFFFWFFFCLLRMRGKRYILQYLETVRFRGEGRGEKELMRGKKNGDVMVDRARAGFGSRVVCFRPPLLLPS